MSTPTTPAPGTPDWLRKRADDEQSADAKLAAIFGENPLMDGSELIAGLRAAAERIEELEQACTELALLNDEENDRLRAENEALKQKSRERLRMAGDLYLALIRLDAIHRDGHGYPSIDERDWLVGPITRFEQAQQEGAK